MTGKRSSPTPEQKAKLVEKLRAATRTERSKIFRMDKENTKLGICGKALRKYWTIAKKHRFDAEKYLPELPGGAGRPRKATLQDLKEVGSYLNQNELVDRNGGVRQKELDKILMEKARERHVKEGRKGVFEMGPQTLANNRASLEYIAAVRLREKGQWNTAERLSAFKSLRTCLSTHATTLVGNEGVHEALIHSIDPCTIRYSEYHGKINAIYSCAWADPDVTADVMDTKNGAKPLSVKMIPIFGCDGSTGPLVFLVKCNPRELDVSKIFFLFCVYVFVC